LSAAETTILKHRARRRDDRLMVRAELWVQ
jgi:hypothetical protein